MYTTGLPPQFEPVPMQTGPQLLSTALTQMAEYMSNAAAEEAPRAPLSPRHPNSRSPYTAAVLGKPAKAGGRRAPTSQLASSQAADRASAAAPAPAPEQEAHEGGGGRTDDLRDKAVTLLSAAVLLSQAQRELLHRQLREAANRAAERRESARNNEAADIMAANFASRVIERGLAIAERHSISEQITRAWTEWNEADASSESGSPIGAALMAKKAARTRPDRADGAPTDFDAAAAGAPAASSSVAPPATPTPLLLPTAPSPCLPPRSPLLAGAFGTPRSAPFTPRLDASELPPDSPLSGGAFGSAALSARSFHSPLSFGSGPFCSAALSSNSPLSGGRFGEAAVRRYTASPQSHVSSYATPASLSSASSPYTYTGCGPMGPLGGLEGGRMPTPEQQDSLGALAKATAAYESGRVPTPEQLDSLRALVKVGTAAVPTMAVAPRGALAAELPAWSSVEGAVHPVLLELAPLGSRSLRVSVTFDGREVQEEVVVVATTEEEEAEATTEEEVVVMAATTEEVAEATEETEAMEEMEAIEDGPEAIATIDAGALAEEVQSEEVQTQAQTEEVRTQAQTEEVQAQAQTQSYAVCAEVQSAVRVGTEASVASDKDAEDESDWDVMDAMTDDESEDETTHLTEAEATDADAAEVEGAGADGTGTAGAGAAEVGVASSQEAEPDGAHKGEATELNADEEAALAAVGTALAASMATDEAMDARMEELEALVEELEAEAALAEAEAEALEAEMEAEMEMEAELEMEAFRTASASPPAMVSRRERVTQADATEAAVDTVPSASAAVEAPVAVEAPAAAEAPVVVEAPAAADQSSELWAAADASAALVAEAMTPAPLFDLNDSEESDGDGDDDVGLLTTLLPAQMAAGEVIHADEEMCVDDASPTANVGVGGEVPTSTGASPGAQAAVASLQVADAGMGIDAEKSAVATPEEDPTAWLSPTLPSARSLRPKGSGSVARGSATHGSASVGEAVPVRSEAGGLPLDLARDDSWIVDPSELTHLTVIGPADDAAAELDGSEADMLAWLTETPKRATAPAAVHGAGTMAGTAAQAAFDGVDDEFVGSLLDEPLPGMDDGDGAGDSRMPRLSFFLKTPPSGEGAASAAERRRITYAVRASERENELQGWLQSSTPVAARGGGKLGLTAINETADQCGDGAESTDGAVTAAERPVRAPPPTRPAVGTAASARPARTSHLEVKPKLPRAMEPNKAVAAGSSRVPLKPSLKQPTVTASKPGHAKPAPQASSRVRAAFGGSKLRRPTGS